MEEIGKHISELLFDNDCVIVPSLGGFLASNQSSRIALPNQVIYPPYRHIAFNVYLKQNDGLLANHIVENENIPYSEANQLIESFTSDCFDKLDNGKKVNISRVGTLFYDKEKNIQFEALRNFNHLIDSFGMEAVHFLPVQHEEKIEKKNIPAEKIIRPSIPAENKIRPAFNVSKRKKIIGLTIFAGALIWFSLNLYLVAPRQYDAISLNPFDSQKIVISKTDSLRNIPSPAVTENKITKTDTPAAVPARAETTASANENNHADNSTENNPVTVIKRPDTISKTVTPPAVVKENIISPATSKNFIIAGVFRIKENAESLLLHLQQTGFSNAQIIEANNFNYVAYDSFNGKEEALSLTDSLRKKNLDGWIWKH